LASWLACRMSEETPPLLFFCDAMRATSLKS
jgi:hypothetical protein